MKLRLFIFILFANSVVTSEAQQTYYTRFQIFTEKEGYQIAEEPGIITQDKKGLLWIASDNGLFSYDGTHFKNYRHIQNDSFSLPHNPISFNYEDHQGTYWVGIPNYGLYRFNLVNGHFVKFRYANEREFNIHEYKISYPYETRAGKLWFALPGFGIASYDSSQNKIIPYKICPSGNCGDYYKASWITRIIEDPDDETLWLGSNNGLIHFYPSTGNFEVCMDYDLNASNIYNHLFFDDQKRFWLGAWAGGVKKFDRSKKTFTSFKWAPGNFGTRNICSGIGSFNKDLLWVGAIDRGIFLFNKNTGEFSPVEDIGSTGNISSSINFFQNKDGVAWLAVEQKLIRINPNENPFHYHSLKKAFTNRPEAHSIITFFRSGNKLFTGVVFEGFVGVYDLETNKFRDIEDPRVRAIHALSGDKNGKIWVASDRGLHILDPVSLKFVDPPIRDQYKKYLTAATYTTEHDEDGTKWLATNLGLVHYDPLNRSAERIGPDPSINQAHDLYAIQGLLKDSRGIFWFGSASLGLGCYRPREKKTIFFNKSRNSKYPQSGCRSITETEDGTILFALTDLGLGILSDPFTDKEDISVLNSSTGYPFDKVSRVFRDRDNNYWLFAANGLFWFDPRTRAMRSFSQEDGISNKGLYSRPYQDEEGHIYLGFSRAFQEFNPKEILQSQNEQGFIYVSSLKINGKEFPLHPSALRKLSLPYNQTNLSFDFAFLNSNLRGGYHYAYKLKGLDENWIEAGKQGTGQYNNLAPGKYVLYIRAAVANGDWNKNEFILPIIVYPPWYGSWWFYTIIAMVTVILVAILFRYRIRQIRKENILKSDFNQKINEIEMRALRAQMNPHFIFNCLNSINRYIVKSDHKTASAYLTKFSKLIRLILDNSANDTISLDREIQTLQLYIEMERLRFDDAFDYEIDTNNITQLETLYIPSMLLQPYVENAIWHGLLHKENGKGKLTIQFQQARENLLIAEIQDNGVGREHAKEMKNREVVRNKSYGMQISSERIQLINEIYNVNACVQVIDLINEDAPAGTRVIVEIPVKQE